MSEQPETTTDGQDTQALRDAIIQNTTAHQFLGAGAGAGKTTVLVDHYFHLLEQDCRPAELVAVTFTEKAAAEMKSRLREKCQEQTQALRRASQDKTRDDAARLESGKQAENWEGILHELEVAPISTIHGLCARLLREHALVAGLDPDFAVLDEVDSQMLLDEVVRQTLLSRLGQEATADELVVALKHDEAVKAITKLVQDRVKLAGVLVDVTYARADHLLRSWKAPRLQPSRELLSEIMGHELYAPSLEHVQSVKGPDDDGLEERRRDVCKIIAEGGLADRSPDRLDAEACQRAIAGLLRLRRVNARNVGQAPAWHQLGLSKEDMVSAQMVFIGPHGMLSGFDERLKQLDCDPFLDESCARTTCALVAEVKAVLEAYQAAKDRHSALDFEDLMEHTRRLWEVRPDVLKDISAALKHVMVDEFQDTNTLQKQVLWPLVTGKPYDPAQPDPLPETGPRLFIVGDAKQSIYRFRNADVTVVNRTHEEMPHGVARNDELTRNFRSTPALIDVYNALFKHQDVMGTEANEPYQASYAAMAAVRDNPPTGQVPLEVHLLTELRDGGGGGTEGGAEGDDDTGLAAMREREAKWLAERLAVLLNDHEGEACRVQRRKEEGGQWETVKPGDIAILFRSMRDVAIYERALRKAGLPYYLVVGQGFFGAQEVQDLVQALRAVENGLDDIALVGALRSPLFGLSDETLYWLGQLGPGPWWWRLQNETRGPEDTERQALVARINGDQRQRLSRAAGVLEDLRRQKNRLSLSALVQAIIDRTGFTAVLAAQFGGRQMVSNARKLVELAGEFETERQALGQSGLRDFIEHLKRMTAEEVREGQAPVEEEAGNSIKLITYHSAKGLQWPIVIVPDLCRKPGGGGFGPAYRFHADEGLVVKTTYLQKQGRDDSYWPPLGRLIKDRNDPEEEAENRRLFYVAATRAQDLLLLSGVARLTQNGAVHGDERKGPLGWINKAIPGALWADNGNLPADAFWRWEDNRLVAAEAPLDASGTYHPATGAETSEAEREVAPLAQRVAPIAAAANGQRRFTATDLSLYDHCPRLYELARRLGLPGAETSLGQGAASDQLSQLEFGTVVHRVLQLVGTGGQEELDRLVPADAQVLRLDPLLDRRAAREAGKIRRRVQAFLNSDVYRDLFVPGSKLRSEAGLAVSIEVDGETVLVEGKIDALVDGTDGALHLIDYKTATYDERHHDQYVVQLGLYCHAVQQATGELPTTAALVYLTGDKPDVRRLDVAEATAHALAAAGEAVKGIWNGGFPTRNEECGHCVGKRLCGKLKRNADEAGEDEDEVAVDEITKNE
jgi:ATP-dependent helicase/nuclease subunit A